MRLVIKNPAGKIAFTTVGENRDHHLPPVLRTFTDRYGRDCGGGGRNSDQQTFAPSQLPGHNCGLIGVDFNLSLIHI